PHPSYSLFSSKILTPLFRNSSFPSESSNTSSNLSDSSEKSALSIAFGGIIGIYLIFHSPVVLRPPVRLAPPS
ncbi:hypothetical protein HMPREF9078_01267, partial [Capnocytophaga sp. oral taxon 380 str. F0488]